MSLIFRKESGERNEALMYIHHLVLKALLFNYTFSTLVYISYNYTFNYTLVQLEFVTILINLFLF